MHFKTLCKIRLYQFFRVIVFLMLQIILHDSILIFSVKLTSQKVAFVGFTIFAWNQHQLKVAYFHETWFYRFHEFFCIFQNVWLQSFDVHKNSFKNLKYKSYFNWVELFSRLKLLLVLRLLSTDWLSFFIYRIWI